MGKTSLGSDESLDLPSNWVWARLGDVCLPPQYGWTTSAASKGRLHLLRTTDITSGTIDWARVPFCRSEPGDRAKYLLQDGDIVISRAGSVGYGYLVKNPPEAVFASYLIRFNPLIDERYVAFYLQSPAYWRSISERSLGIAIPNVNASNLTEIAVAVSPLPEQQRIVAKIEQLFSDLDAGVAALQKAKAQLKRYRQAVLKAAVAGELTAEWRAANGGKVEPASVLLERIRGERAESAKVKTKPLPPLNTAELGELPEGWCWTTFGRLMSNFRSGSTAVPGDEHTQFPILRSSSVRARQIDYTDIRFLTEEQSRNSANFLHAGDLLFTRLSGTIEYVGNCAMVRNARASSIQYPDRIFRATLTDNRLSPFVELWFSGPLARKQTMALTKSTAGHQRISMGAISERYIPLPPLLEQEHIAAEVERRLSVADEIERTVDASLAQAERLRQSILKRAFAGKLVPQDPNDEPADKLLERIRQAHVAKDTVSGKSRAGSRGAAALRPYQPRRYDGGKRGL